MESLSNLYEEFKKFESARFFKWIVTWLPPFKVERLAIPLEFQASATRRSLFSQLNHPP